ncbi:MAG: glycosyltransferase family 25 protein [Halothiobacillaceae bacterium]
MSARNLPPMVVISLPGSADRRAQVRARMDSAGLAFSFLDAVDGRAGRHVLLERFDAKGFMIRHGRPPVPGEAGCYASHYLAWRQCVEMGRPIVIFEDDFGLAEDAVSRFALAARLAEHFDFLRLEPATPRPERLVWKGEQGGVVRFLKVPQCATCYQVTPRAASALISASTRFVYPVDVFIRNQFLHGVPVHGLRPAPVERARDSAAISIIGDRHRDKGPLWCKFSKIGIRSANALRNGLTNLRFMTTVDRHRLPLDLPEDR